MKILRRSHSVAQFYNIIELGEWTGNIYRPVRLGIMSFLRVIRFTVLILSNRYTKGQKTLNLIHCAILNLQQQSIQYNSLIVVGATMRSQCPNTRKG